MIAISWNDDSNDKITITPNEGKGSTEEAVTVTVSTPANEGIDRSRTIYVTNNNETKSISIFQPGKREILNDYSGNQWNAFDGGFYVLKE